MSWKWPPERERERERAEREAGEFNNVAADKDRYYAQFNNHEQENDTVPLTN